MTYRRMDQVCEMQKGESSHITIAMYFRLQLRKWNYSLHGVECRCLPNRGLSFKNSDLRFIAAEKITFTPYSFRMIDEHLEP